MVAALCQRVRVQLGASEAVLLAAPTIPNAGKVRATGSRDSVDVRVTGFGSEQSRPKSALCLGLRLGSVHGPCTGPSSSFACRGEIGHRDPSSQNLTCTHLCWGGLLRLHVPLLRLCYRLPMPLARRAALQRGARPGSAWRCSLRMAPDSGAFIGRGWPGGRARRRPIWGGALS